MAVYRVKVLEWGRTRDYFTAYCASLQLNKFRKEESDHLFTPEEILLHRYPAFKESVTSYTDPDRGAGGDWQALRANLRGTK